MPKLNEKTLSLAILLAVLVVQAIVLAPELSTAQYRDTDSVSHWGLIKGMADAVERGEDPLDFWSAEVSFGVPMARWYQPLSHLLVLGIYLALGKSVSLMTVFLWAKHLSILILPAILYLTVRWLDFPPLVAAATALLAPLIGGPGPGQLGMELRSWLMFGVFPQSVGTILMLLAIGLSYRAIRTGRWVALAGALIGVTALAHLIYGWMAALTACLIALLPDPLVTRRVRILRTVAMGAVAGVLVAFQLLPILSEGYLINRPHLEPAEKYDSFGAVQVLQWLFGGQLMDHERLPVLTLLAFLGAGLLLWRWRKTRKLGAPELFVLAAAAFWIMIFFGRPTWGMLVALIGVTRDLHLHRVLASVQLFLVFLAAIGLATLWRETSRRWHPAAAAALTGVLLIPMISERAAFLSAHDAGGQMTKSAVEAEGPTLDKALAAVTERGGRVYPGLSFGWGGVFKVGSSPVYTFVALRLIPAVASTYNSSSLASDLMPRFDEMRPVQYRLFNIHTVLAPAMPGAPPFLTPVAEFGRFRLLDAPGSGYFGVVDVPAAAEITRDTFYDVNDAWLHGDWLDKNQYLWLDFHGDAPKDLPRATASYLPAIAPAPAAPGTALNEKQTGQVYEADLDVARQSFALFRMTWHPDWKVLVDGKPVTTVMLSPGFLGAPVEPGKHHILCRYEPGGAKPLMAFAGLAIALLAIGGEGLRYRVRKESKARC